MTQQGNEDPNDQLLLILIGIPALVLLGPGLLAKLVPSAQHLLLQYRVLTADNVLIHITPVAGLDLGRCAIAVGLVALAIAGLVLYIRARRRAAVR